MKPVDYKCKSCGNIDEHWYSHGETIKQKGVCVQCGNESVRQFNISGVHVYRGKTGNAKTGYTTEKGYIKKTS